MAIGGTLFALAMVDRFVQVALPRALSRGMVSAGRSVLIGERDEMAGSSADHLLEKFGMREVGRFELPPDGESAPLLRVTDAAIQVTRDDRAEIVLLAMRWDDHIRRDLVCERLRILPVPILLLPDRSVGTILSRPTHEIGTQIMVELQRAPLSWVEMALKRAVDLVVTATALVLLSPLLAATAWAIKLDSRGPAIFRQRRRGFSGREFTIYKFRTMHVLESGPTIRQAKRGDARVTRLGRMLRSTSIDELPQLLNVLNGEMSIIGPRPHAVAHDGEYGQLIANYAFRHHVKPGLTGWAQIHGFRGETARLELMKRRVDLDLWYIDNWSLWLDFQILIKTFFEVLRKRNAF